jgi:serine/threonine-protein kinase
MSPERRQEIEALFEGALEREPAERSGLLDRACGDDVELRAEVEALLAAHERAGGVLESDPTRAAAEAIASSPVGERIGRYRILAELGRGGMGVVYLAESDDSTFRRQVAVKVIPGGPGMGELHRRFEAERRILASLDHPHIARLLDGGLTDDGRQYLVMEHVEGLPIDEYCERNRLGVDDRLRLFCTVARAAHHAHRSLVVHRDLKPSNVMVTSEGVVKLLDFGIAKMLDPTSLGHTAPLTLTGIRLMTPEYASPEQVLGDPVTTATDVYGLGAVLYELLTGVTPFRLVGRTWGECERLILEEEPPRPSTAVGLVGGAASARGKTTGDNGGPPLHLGGWEPTGTEVHDLERRRRANHLRRRLRGDLDRIALMALRKEPARRYGSAEQLAEDVERHLDAEPVLARGDAAPYRARKFIFRHRWGVGAAALVALSVGGGVVTTSWQAREAAEQATIAAAQRDRATRVASLMMEVFRLTDPTESLGDTITARQIVDQGIERIMAQLGDQPDVQSAMLLEVARVYENLGLLSRAEELVQRSLVLRAEHFGEESLETSESRSRMGQILAARGRRPEAIEQFRRSIEVREARLEAPDSLLAATQASLAFELRSAGHYDEAKKLFQAAVATQRGLPGDDATVANTLLGLAATYHDQGAFDEAEALFQAALAEYDPSRPHPMAAAALLNVGMIRRLREQYRSAGPLVEAGYEMRVALYEPEHPAVIEGLSQWGMLLQALGRLEEAERQLETAVERGNRKLGPEHEMTTTARATLAHLLTQTGRYAEASARLDTVLAAKRGRHEAGHPSIVFSLVQSADPHLEAGRLREARALLDEAMAITGPQGVYGLLALHGLADIALREGRLDEADRLLDDALAIAAERLRDNHRYTLALRRSQAAVLIERDRAQDAAALLERALADERAKLPEPHPKIGYTLLCLGEAYLGVGEPYRADSILQRAARNFAELPAAHWRHGEVMSLRGLALRAQHGAGEVEAEWLLGEGLRVIRAHLGPDAPQARRAAARLRR